VDSDPSRHSLSKKPVSDHLDTVRSLALNRIDKQGNQFINDAKAIYASAETGFHETKTAKYVADRLTSLGLSVETNLAMTGLKSTLKGPKAGPHIAVIAELDGLLVPTHPGVNADTGAVHACGHHAQIGMLLGVATALSDDEIRKHISGSVTFVLTPAEEFIEIEKRLALRDSGEIEFLSGKQEMIRLGVFDDVDMAMMTHTTSGNGDSAISIGGTSNAHVSHQVKYIGKSAHAGGAPDQGINALQAATLATTAVNAIRETFRERDVVRVHGMLSRGGTSVNAVPSDVLYEGRVRARSVEILEDIKERVIRCYRAGAMAMGAKVEVTEVAGYHALKQNSGLIDVFVRNARQIVGRSEVTVNNPAQAQGGSTDMGDLSTLMPVIHPYTNAASGVGHGDDYLVEDYDRAVNIPAKIMTATLLELFDNDSSEAKKILKSHTPKYSVDEYVELQRSRFSSTLHEDELLA